ncbi:hypothetical protein [Candidatus Magnetaquicoccus inordinatus]|uniref:hypothetical protein n=1 Tax=Candidatus Magnetaquicoccus inordinatus TaxID=2496818 RepID=UPI00102BFA74|nr:hypothetical protein [Candidatus Magnetaquicoccus inordinatus]
MRKHWLMGLFCVLTFVVSPAYARTPVPVVNYDGLFVATASGTLPSIEQIKSAILAGAARAGWSSVLQGDNTIISTLVVRNKHTVVVQIPFSPTQYSIKYYNSINMKAVDKNGQMVIHPFYNTWVDALRNAIHLELQKY